METRIYRNLAVRPLIVEDGRSDPALVRQRILDLGNRNRLPWALSLLRTLEDGSCENSRGLGLAGDVSPEGRS